MKADKWVLKIHCFKCEARVDHNHGEHVLVEQPNTYQFWCNRCVSGFGQMVLFGDVS